MPSLVDSSFRFLAPFLSPDQKARRETAKALRAARMRTFPEWYLTRSILAAGLVGVGTSLLVALVLWLERPASLAPPLRASLVVGLGVVAAMLTRLAFLLYPRVRARTRVSEIEGEYQSVVVLCYALARGGMGTLDIFRAVAKERSTYGEVSVEFDVVVRDVEMFGIDVVKALQNAAASTPSALLKGFFEGLVSILNSGADPRDYFKRQAEVQLAHAEAATEKELASAGMLAEVYVSSFLVIPLLVLVVLSGLSSLGNGQERFIPYVVYGLIPAGTVFCLVALEVMMPTRELPWRDARETRLADFGIATIRAAPRAAVPSEATTSDLRLPVRERVQRGLASRVEAFTQQPLDALAWSGPLALLVLAATMAPFLASHPTRDGLLDRGLVLLLVAAAVALAPVALFHERRVRRARRVETALPELLSKLAGFNERGIGLLQSFQILGRASSGPLAADIRMLDRDVRVNGSLQSAIGRLRERVRTMRMTKLAVLLERASMATGSLKEVLDIAAADETRSESLRARKRQTMMSYVLVVYLVFGVFLYVAYMTTSLFYGNASFAIAVGSGAASKVGSHGLSPADARVMFFDAVVLQGVACGLIAGRMGEGHTLSGVKHAIVLAGVAAVVFSVGVM
jgi:flagellar protein FlaJ